jgi:hypothetical protein
MIIQSQQHTAKLDKSKAKDGPTHRYGPYKVKGKIKVAGSQIETFWGDRQKQPQRSASQIRPPHPRNQPAA